jgi:hypothetical protein
MIERSRLIGLILFCLAAHWLTNAACAQTFAPAGEKKSTLKSTIPRLFEGLPADLQTKVRSNPVRRDRVNDWLREHVEGKGKTIEVAFPARVTAERDSDGTYQVGFELNDVMINVLGDEWRLQLLDGVPKQASVIGFMHVNPAEAERLADLKQFNLRATVKRATLNTDQTLRRPRRSLFDSHRHGDRGKEVCATENRRKVGLGSEALAAITSGRLKLRMLTRWDARVHWCRMRPA